MSDTVSWFGKDWLARYADALGVYITLLILQFRVRYATDIPLLCRDEALLEARLKPYLSLFLRDEELAGAVENGKKFLKAFVEHTPFPEYEATLDTFELNYYPVLKDAYLRYTNRKELAVKIAGYDAGSLIRRFLGDVASNRFSKGKITRAGSSILLTPFSELMKFYGLAQEDVRGLLKILRLSGIMFLDIIPAPVLEQEFLASLS